MREPQTPIPDDEARAVSAPLVYERAIFRVVRPSEGADFVEAWGDSGWERSETFNSGDFMRSPPASDATLREAGVPESDWAGLSGSGLRGPRPMHPDRPDRSPNVQDAPSPLPKSGSFRTWDLLLSAGFVPNVSAIVPTLHFDFGNLHLEASDTLGERLQPVILIHGLMHTRGSVGQLETELPRELESQELCLALLAWCIDEYWSGPFVPRIPSPWLEEGRACRERLPWVKAEADAKAAADAERARWQQCAVRRDWARVARKELRRLFAESGDDDLVVTLAFNGESLRITCGGQVLLMQGTGKAWRGEFAIRASAMQPLPSRFHDDPVVFAVVDGTLRVGDDQYDGLERITGDTPVPNAPSARASSVRVLLGPSMYDGSLVRVVSVNDGSPVSEIWQASSRAWSATSVNDPAICMRGRPVTAADFDRFRVPSGERIECWT